MTEYNYFCEAKEYNDEDSFQQKRFRIFNVEVTEEEYKSIDKIRPKLEFDKNESKTTRFQTAFKKHWNTLNSNDKQKYYDIPHFNHVMFTSITGVKKNNDNYEK